MPRIVIGVPVYNGASDLERCFRSLRAQDCLDLEILVSDNASTDATPEILARFAASDRRIRIIRQKHNLDMSANFAAVNDAADCEFFAWRAHDDWSDPDWARILVGLLQNNPKANLAMSRTVFYHRDYSGTVTLEHAAPATPADDYARVKLAANMQAEWFYGFYRHAELVRVFNRTRELFPNPWSQDFGVLLHFVLSGRLIGTNATAFHSQENIRSMKYRPAHWRVGLSDFLRFCRVAHIAARESGLPLGPKLAFYLSLPKFAGHHTEKPRRILRGWVKERLGGTGATRRARPRRGGS